MNCPDCGAEPGNLHKDGCDVERCPDCGGQLLSCDCPPEHPRTPWEGEWPGVAECKRRGWYAVCPGDGTGWHTVPPGTPGAHPDLNRLAAETRWNSETKEYEDIR